MMGKRILTIATITGALAVVGGFAIPAQNKYTLKVPNGLAFSEFRGYESWSVVAISENEGQLAVILGNPAMIGAYRAGVPANGKPFPDGSKMAKIHWDPQKKEAEPGQPIVPGTQHDVDFMVKDSKRFPDSGGGGWAVFDYTATFQYVYARYIGRSPTTGERCQVRVCVPHNRPGERLRLHGLRASVGG